MNTELSAEALAVVEKAKKLFALANNNDNEHQASAALAKGMELLAAYNLDMAVIGTSAKGSQRKDTNLKGGLYQWQRDVWEHVAKLNFCMYWSIRGLAKGQSYEHRILGRHENVISTQVMADYLCKTTERLAQEWAREQDINVFCSSAIAYREGMASRITERLWRLRRDRMADEEAKREEQAKPSNGAASGNSLILADVIQTEEDLNNDYIYGYEPGTHARQRAEWMARRAAAQAEAERILRERDEAEARDPSLKAAREEAAAKAEAAQQEYYRKEEAKRAKRRKSERSYRHRAETPQEKRRRTEGYARGYDRGGDIGFDPQVVNDSKRRIR